MSELRTDTVSAVISSSRRAALVVSADADGAVIPPDAMSVVRARFAASLSCGVRVERCDWMMAGDG